MRRILALLLCLLGIAVLDHALMRFADLRQIRYLPGTALDLLWQGTTPPRRNMALSEIGGLVLLWLGALRLGFAHGVGRGDHDRLLALLLALAAGRSLIGVGEGFSVDFVLLAALCGLVALVLNGLLSRR